MSDLGIKIRDYFTDSSKKRGDFEESWLQDLRQYKGIYDPDVVAKLDPKRSKAFIRETRTKVRTIDARVMDMLFPANGEKNWEVVNTPKPSVPPQIEGIILANIQKILQEQGENRQPTKDEFALAVKTYAEETCKKMSNTINDQLSEIKYRSIIRDVMHSGHLYGTGWLKGPLVDQVMSKHWEMQDDGKGNMVWSLVEVLENIPYAEFRPIWSCYPDMSATELNACRYIIERHVMPRHLLLKLAARPDFNSTTIRQYIEDNPDGKAEYATYESELYQLKEKETKPRATLKGCYELIEYWGWVAGSDLLMFDDGTGNLGKLIDENNVLDDFACNVWVIGNEVVKIAIQPVSGVTLPYYAYYFDKDETSIFGEGLAAIMRDPQKLVNASIRAMIDNASHCAGPQYEVNIDLLASGEDITDIGSFKVWARTGRDADIAGKEVVRVKNMQSFTPEFMNMYGLFSRLGDEVTIVPRYLQGDARVSGAGRTASGLSMLMGQANVGLSDLVKMFDEGITKPFITAMYDWNMQFNPDGSIKGDMKAVARGSTALMAKEIRAQQIQTFLQMTLNPADASWVKRGNLLRRWAESTDIGGDEAVYTQDEHDMIMEQQAEQMKNQAEQQNGPGYNQLASIIKQLEDGMKMFADKLGNIENFIADSIEGRENEINQSRAA